jgi:uncharacterized protein (DUF1697 family)
MVPHLEIRDAIAMIARMPRYVAFLRGVSPMNARMLEVKRAFESAGFTDVKTVLSSGNVVFDARAASPPSLERKIEDAMHKELGRSFLTIVRSIDSLRDMLASDPFREARLKTGSKRVVTFLREPPAGLKLPIEQDGVRILRLHGNSLLSAYLPTPKGPVFMALIEKAAGKQQTTRTWQTIEKVVR